MSEPYIGDGARIGIAINADNSGTTWGGTPGTEIAVYPVPGTMKFDEAVKQTPVSVLAVDEYANVTGGVSYTGSFEMPASYLGMELFLQAILGGTLTKTGATAPYVWTPALADPLLYCRIGYYEQLRDATAVSRRFTNAVITALTISCNAEEEARCAVSWAAPTLTVGAEAIPTPVALEPILWSHLAPSFNSVTTHALNSVSVEIAQPVTDGKFQMAASTPTAMRYINRAGQRTFSVEVDFLHDADVDTLAALTSVIPLALVWNNGGTTTAERELNISSSYMYRVGRPHEGGAWDVKNTTLQWFSRAASAPFAITVSNGDDAIP
jgi:hypothetical protein